jgi:hypothetical protein
MGIVIQNDDEFGGHASVYGNGMAGHRTKNTLP